MHVDDVPQTCVHRIMTTFIVKTHALPEDISCRQRKSAPSRKACHDSFDLTTVHAAALWAICRQASCACNGWPNQEPRSRTSCQSCACTWQFSTQRNPRHKHNPKGTTDAHGNQEPKGSLGVSISLKAVLMLMVLYPAFWWIPSHKRIPEAELCSWLLSCPKSSWTLTPIRKHQIITQIHPNPYQKSLDSHVSILLNTIVMLTGLGRGTAFWDSETSRLLWQTFNSVNTH